MKNATATPDADRPEVGQAVDVTAVPAEQICEWIKAHKLERHRGCTGFRLHELGLVNLVSAPDSGRSRPQDRGDGSHPTFANA